MKRPKISIGISPDGQALLIKIPVAFVLVEVAKQKEGMVIRHVPDVVRHLTQREQEIFQGVASGRANKEIANIFNLSERTIKFHVSHILDKLGLRSRIEVARLYGGSNGHDLAGKAGGSSPRIISANHAA